MTALNITSRVASVLGLLSLSLSGEIAPAWLMAGWATWTFSFIADRYPEFQSRLRHWETLAVAGMIATLFLDFFVFRSTIFIALTHFLILFQSFKLAGEKARKDSLQIFLFSFFQILAACTLSVDLWHAGILIALIPTAAAALFWNHIEREYEAGAGEVVPQTSDAQQRYRRIATLICAAALPLNLILTLAVFLLFPRLTLNARLPGFSGRRTGYTDQVNLSQKGNLEQNSAVVLWLNFPKTSERESWDGYLRGETLSRFNGREWNAIKDVHYRMFTPDLNGVFVIRQPKSPSHLIRQTITLADTSAGTLFAVGKPLKILAPLPVIQENEGGTLRWLMSLQRPLRYEVVSEPFSDTDVRPIHQELPELPLARIRTLTKEIAGRGTPQKQAQAIQDYLQKNYRYSTHFGDRVPENPIDYFLFEHREGSCGHFASAMALMLRLQNIPSRLVAGYLKGQWNEPAQAVVIRSRDAHAWVEAYIPEKGWVSFDPTPIPASGPQSRQTFYIQLAQYWDYLGLQWNRFVIQYDLYSQLKAFSALKGTSGRFGATLTAWWSKVQSIFKRHDADRSAESDKDSAARFPFKEMCVFLFLAFVSFLWVVRKHRESSDLSIRFYSQFLDRMSRAGHPKTPEETGQEFAQRLQTNWPEHGSIACDVTNRYYELRFSPPKQ